MKQFLNAGAIAIGGVLVVTLVACSSSEATTTETPFAPTTTSGKEPKLSLVHSPAAIAAAKNLSLGGSKSTGGGAHTLSAGAPGTCGITSGDPTCDTCITGTCCTEGAACTSDADCTALLSCYDACTDDSCFSSCDSAHRPGTIVLQTFISCVDSGCATECGGPPPSTGTGACAGVTSGDPTCDACLTTTCCSDVTSCLGDADCTDLMTCLDSCSDSTCESTCETAHPAGTAELTSLSSCVDTNCTACGGGSAPPPPTPPPGPPTCGLSSGDGTCDTCLDTSCCAESDTCVRDTDCNALLVCLGACTDETCATTCYAAHTPGSALLDSVMSCLSTNCSTTCF